MKEYDMKLKVCYISSIAKGNANLSTAKVSNTLCGIYYFLVFIL